MELHHEEDLFPSASLCQDTALVVEKLLQLLQMGCTGDIWLLHQGPLVMLPEEEKQIKKGERGEEQSSCLAQNQDIKNKINQSYKGCEEEKMS